MPITKQILNISYKLIFGNARVGLDSCKGVLQLEATFIDVKTFSLTGFPKNLLQNIRKRIRFGGNYPSIFTLFGQNDSKTDFFCNLDYIYHKYKVVQRNLKHFKFW